MVTRGMVVLVLVAAAVLTSCGTSYHYVSNSSTGTFFKVPSSWKVYGKSQVLAASGQLSTSGGAERFLVAFDGSPHPSLNDDFSSSYPFGIASVRLLSQQEQDQYSFANLRNEIFPVDNVANQDPNSIHIVSPPTVVTHGTLRGMRMEYSLKSNGAAFTVDQIGYVDTPTTKVWYLIVGCQLSCYQRYSGDIHRVIGSWTVEGK
jgi:hypothetical protein